MISIKSENYIIKIFSLDNGKAPYLEWINNFKDKNTKLRITARIARFARGHFGDCKSLGDDIFEARFFFGSGYRVYFSVQNEQIVLLLTGGDKSSQFADIQKAKRYLGIFLEGENANKKY